MHLLFSLARREAAAQYLLKSCSRQNADNDDDDGDKGLEDSSDKKNV